MKRNTIALLCVATALPCLAGCPVPQPPVQQTFLVDAGGRGSSVQGNQGDLLYIVLRANPSTGSAWGQANPDSAQPVVTYHKQWFVADDAGSDSSPGHGGVLIMEFGIGSEGTRQLTLELRQAGAPATDPPVGTFSISVQSMG